MKTVTTYFRTLALVVLIAAAPYLCPAQAWKSQATDSLFAIARQEAFSGNYTSSKQKLRYILSRHPQHADARVMTARMFAWQEMYDSARHQLQVVRNAFPSNEDAMSALVDVEFWSGHYPEALMLIEQLLALTPGRHDLLLKKARTFQAMSRPAEAWATLETLLAIEPGLDEAVVLQHEIRAQRSKYHARVTGAVDVFNRIYATARTVNIEAGRMNSWGLSIIRLNVADRFGISASQVETELYPKMSERVHAYVNYGYSAGKLFPSHRLGAEVFVKTGKKMEVSAGARYLDFSSSRALICTGSLGFYVGSYWFSFRPYMTGYESRMRSSGVATLRRYFRDAETYVSLSGGLGFSPDYARIQSSFGIGNDGIQSFNSQRSALSWQKKLKHSWIVSLSLEVTRHEMSGDGEYLLITSSSIGVKRKL